MPITSSPATPPRPTPSPRALAEGDLLAGRYRIESLLLARPSSADYAATNLRSGARVAVHVLVLKNARSSANHSTARAAFLADGRRATTLSGPHVARVLDVGITDAGHPWIVREHIASDTLATYLGEHGSIRTTDAVDVALAVCDALAEAHAAGIVHGSLGPHAVHVAWSASGLAETKVTSLPETPFASDAACALRAPEQLLPGTKVDERVDVWATALLLHTMIAGAPPFATDTPQAAILSVMEDEAPSLAGIPDELAEVVERSLAKDPAARPRDILELAEAIVCFSSHPDIARDRIARRRPSHVGASESARTLIVEKAFYEALAREEEAARRGKRLALPTAADEATVEISPSVRDLLAPAREPEPTAKARSTMAKASADATILTRKVDVDAGLPRRRALKVLGLVTAAASVALLVLIGTEGARLSRRAPTAAQTAAAAAAPPPALSELPAAPSREAAAPATSGTTP